MTPAQRARAEHIIVGLRERERQLETRLAGWEYEALLLLQELAAEPVRVPQENTWMWESCDDALAGMTCPWCNRQGTDTCQHADDAKTFSRIGT